MKKQKVRKLSLKKTTVNRLTNTELQKMEGGSFLLTGGCGAFTLGCATDITRIIRTIILPTGG